MSYPPEIDIGTASGRLALASANLGCRWNDQRLTTPIPTGFPDLTDPNIVRLLEDDLRALAPAAKIAGSAGSWVGTLPGPLGNFVVRDELRETVLALLVSLALELEDAARR